LRTPLSGARPLGRRRRGDEVRARHRRSRQRAHRDDARVHRGGISQDHLRSAL